MAEAVKTEGQRANSRLSNPAKHTRHGCNRVGQQLPHQALTGGLAKYHLPALQLTEQHLHQLSNHSLIFWRQQRCQGCSSLHGLVRPRGACLLQALPDGAPHLGRGCAARGILPLSIASLQSRK